MTHGKAPMGDYKIKTSSNLHGTARRQRQLTLRMTVSMAWRNIIVRLGRSMLVTSGIILALAFLTYITCSDTVARAVVANAPADMLEKLRESGTLELLDDADAKIQTRWMVGLALLVSFVGILNAMVLSVTERYSEIGTMKCLGALDALVVRLFLLESLFQGVVGTAIGILVGLGLSFAEAQASYGAGVWAVAPWGDVMRLTVISFLAGVTLTVAAALYPGWRAAKMRPVDAMRAQV
jgi:putative ABC transport system permease protein